MHGPIALLLALLLTSTVLGLEPVRALAINWNELTLGFRELVSRLAQPLLLGLVASSVAALTLIALTGARGVALLVALYVGLWLQTSVLVGDYGPFDGRTLVWDDFARRRSFELLIWTGLVAGALWQAGRVRRVAGLIAAVVLALYAASFGEQVLRAAPFPTRARPAPLNVSLSSYSARGNVIVIVLDTLQSDFFAELLQDPEFASSVPPGFTYYRNATSYYGSTQFSLQSILTSVRIPDSVGAGPFLETAMRSSLPARLGEQGFDVALATFATGNMPGCKPTLGAYDCVRLDELLANDPAIAADNLWRADTSELLRLALFRSSPQILKQRIRGRRGWSLAPPFPPLALPSHVDPRIEAATRTDLQVLEKLTRELEVVDARPRFRFLHLHTPHHPVSVDARCGRVETADLLELERGQTVAAARCILSRVFDHLRALDAAGGYDASTIFLLADHGSRFPVDRAVASPPLPAPDGLDAGFDWTSRGLPLFLAKPPGERGALTVSDRPVALCDVPSSVYAVLELPARAGCSSIFDPEARATQRRFYRYPDYREQRGLEPDGFEFEAFAIQGHAWSPQSWQRVEDVRAERGERGTR